jgi:hypothetical protein
MMEIRMLNIKKLRYENMLMLSYPKVMRMERRVEMRERVKEIFDKSLQHHDEYLHCMLVENTMLSRMEMSSHEYMVMGRRIWENEVEVVSLKSIIKRYEYLSESIARYIIKVILRVYWRIKK